LDEDTTPGGDAADTPGSLRGTEEGSVAAEEEPPNRKTIDELQKEVVELQLRLQVAQLQSQLGSSNPVPGRTGNSKNNFPLPSAFRGDSTSNCTLFLFKCKEYFEEDKARFEHDEAKVRFGGSLLQDRAAQQYMSWSEARGGAAKILWTDFHTFCQNLVEDPLTRANKAGEAFWQAKQYAGQTVAAFAIYLEQCLNEAGVSEDLPESWKAHALLFKVSPVLRRALWARVPKKAPDTWKEMLEQLQLAESTTDVGSERSVSTSGRSHDRDTPAPGRSHDRGNKRDRRANTVGEGQPAAKKGNGGNKFPSGKGSRGTGKDQISNGCWECGKQGHMSKDCPVEKKNSRNSQGKDQARST
jgi:hypothetical protein